MLNLMRNAQCVMRNVKIFMLSLLILSISQIANAATQPVTDKAGLLSASDIETLNKKIRGVEQAHKIKIGVVFVKSVGGDLVSASHELLEKNFSNGMNGGIVLLVDMKNRKYEIDTDSRMRERVTNHDGIPILKDSFKSSLSAGDYSGAVNNFVDGVDELVTYYEKNGAPYGSRTDGFDPMAAMMAVVVALFLGVMIRSSLIGSMSNIHHAMEAIDYLKRNTVKFQEKRDTFLFMNVKRRPKSGGGSRGGEGSHGGGGHGGGGGSF